MRGREEAETAPGRLKAVRVSEGRAIAQEKSPGPGSCFRLESVTLSSGSVFTPGNSSFGELEYTHYMSSKHLAWFLHPEIFNLLFAVLTIRAPLGLN